jgi:uncharacterized protein with PQ loop repeat
MSKQSEVMHHHSVRKRIHQRHEEFPHPDRKKQIIDKLIYPIGILGPITAIPQLIDIFIHKNVAGLSLFTWSLWAIFNVFWLAYGFLHKEKPIIITYIMWLFVNVSVVVGIILYK